MFLQCGGGKQNQNEITIKNKKSDQSSVFAFLVHGFVLALALVTIPLLGCGGRLIVILRRGFGGFARLRVPLGCIGLPVDGRAGCREEKVGIEALFGCC